MAAAPSVALLWQPDAIGLNPATFLAPEPRSRLAPAVYAKPHDAYMREAWEAVNRALLQLNAAVAAGLEPHGWRRIDRGLQPWAAFALPLGDGFWATIDLRIASMKFPDPWPVPLDLRVGAGYEPATDLMPIVTLPWQVALVDESTPDSSTGLALNGPEDTDLTANTIIQRSRKQAVAFAEQYRSVDALDTTLAGTASAPPDYEHVTLRAVLLAAAGEHARARMALDGFRDGDLEETQKRVYRRFVRQLGRWLDAGGPPVPPLEQTLSQLPAPPPMPQAPSWADSRQRSRDRQAALKAVRAGAHGKSREEITELFVSEYGRRGLEAPSPSEISVVADMLEAEGRPFGRSRQKWKALTLLRGVVGDTVGAVRHGMDPNPDWLQPPDEASYPIRATGGFAAVSLNEDALPRLARASAEGRQHLGPHVLVDLWLKTSGGEEAGRVVVHLGEAAVGTLPAHVAVKYAPEMTAAASMDELVRVPGRLLAATAGMPPILEIREPSQGPKAS